MLVADAPVTCDGSPPIEVLPVRCGG